MKASINARLDQIERTLTTRQETLEGVIVRIKYARIPVPVDDEEGADEDVEERVQEEEDDISHEREIRALLKRAHVPQGQVRLVYESGGHVWNDEGSIACWCGEKHDRRVA